MSGQVIFIDDESAIRQAVQQWLELSGFRVRTCASAREALGLIDRDFPGVLISDVRMPDLDGLGLLERLVHIPGPVLMIVMAVMCKYAKVIPGRMETGAKSCYKLISTSLIWPTMIGLGMLYVPLESVVSVFSVAYVAVCASVVLSMAIVSFLLARFLNMYSVEASIVTVCHSGLGGTGDVAILSACDRMGLMPFAQISTRIGGASTVILATMLLAAFS